MKKAPIYKHSGEYAQEHGELEKYFASFQAHQACSKAIDQAIADNYHDYRLSDAGAREVIAKFGLERTMYVLAATVREMNHDGRISSNNKDWASSFPLVEDTIVAGGTVRDRNAELRLYRAHPGLIDLFLDQVRDEAAISHPVYRGTFDEAKEAGEVAEYRASYRANKLCQREIEQAIFDGWDGTRISPDVVKGVLGRFGQERVAYVLANSVQQKTGDERFSSDNWAWAKSIPMYVPAEKRLAYTVTSHSTKLDDFITVARQEMFQMKQERGPAKSRKPSVRKKLKEQPDAPDTPKPAKPRARKQER